MTTAETKPKPWMRQALLAAAIYNLIWGAWAIFWPQLAFQWTGMPLPNYPELWQCIGMIVGVYGIGYAAASFDPYRHWPVVLVGFLGKVFGPIGFAKALWEGRFPPAFGVNILFNDLVWWVPFGLILMGAYQAQLQWRRNASPEIVRFALRARTTDGLTLDELSRRQPLLVVFLRHAGCTFCREALADLAKHRKTIEASGTKLVIVHMGQPEEGEDLLVQYGLLGVTQVSDPNLGLYRAFGLPKGGLLELFGPKVLARGVEAAILGRHGIGVPPTDPFQMPGIFLLSHGQVLKSFRHQSISDRPDYLKLVDLDAQARLEFSA